ncbi:MAG: hypothetical protein Q8J96_03185 [Rhodocyclaceae bacterium]|jgi:hypothetical protein|nr:hypothetical protein [Rhodocyclaceae bacterium]MDP3030949.1 hypothetical protein [Rhodocyclaceae bacterium]
MDILSAITWHHLAFLFALAFIAIFRQPLSELIRRTTRIGKDGLSAGPAGPAPDAQREKFDPEAVQQLLDVIGNSIVITDIEGRVRTELKEKGLSAEGDTIKVLIRHLAGTKLLLSFEQIHNLIFGSQIFLLKKLNEVAGQGRPFSFVCSHIDHVKTLYPDELGEWSFDQYLEFMFSRLLIVRHGDQIHITNLGVEYLTWLARNGRSENNPL